MTLSQRDLRTHTTASCSSTYSPSPDSLLLNGSTEPLTNPRSQACLTSLRTLRSQLETIDPELPKLSTYPLRIASSNNFPTAAGLASSAAGFAALVRAIADLYQLPQSPNELSLIARQGSGSACRSLLGGYVAWDAGSQPNGSDSKARLIAPKEHWPEMRALILVASAEKKSVSSTSGMQTTVATSSLFRTRAEQVVPRAMHEVESAIAARDFASFAKVTMRESNSFHACCLDTDPPIFYLNDTSRAAIRAVEKINERAGKAVAAYTFDAGPNCVVYHLEKNRDVVLGGFRRALSQVEGWQQQQQQQQESSSITSNKNNIDDNEDDVDDPILQTLSKGITRVIHTSVGEGPISLKEEEEHLIDEKGQPVSSSL